MKLILIYLILFINFSVLLSSCVDPFEIFNENPENRHHQCSKNPINNFELDHASPEKRYILSIDQGTSSSRIAILDEFLHIVTIEKIEHEQIHEQPGWTEHDPMQLFLNINLLLDRIYHHKKEILPLIKAVGITNQRETCLVWDKKTGEHLSNAIVWHDTRTSKLVDEFLLKRKNNKDYYRKKTGLPMTTYFSAFKYKWMIDNIPQLKEKIEAKNIDDICFGTIDSWIIFKLTGKHYTDVTNASRTMLMNLETLDWDDELLHDFGIPRQVLPRILASTDNFGVIKDGHLKNIPITGVIGDQQSSCIGHLLDIGEVKNTYGTGSFILMNSGNKIVHSNFGLLTTVLYKSAGDEQCLYALEGAIESAGSVIDWLKDNIHFIDDYQKLHPMFESVDNSSTVTFVPAFSGLFSPHWDNTARGLIIGLTTSTKQGHILHAAFEAISLRGWEIIKSFEKESGIDIKKLKVDGGLAISTDFLQTQCNVLNFTVEKPKENEITIIGSAIVAGLEPSIAIWKNFDELRKLSHVEIDFKPQWTEEHRKDVIKRWLKAIEKAKNWLD